jgi:hypothetical protein
MDWINFLEEKTETMIINLGISADWAIYLVPSNILCKRQTTGFKFYT